MDARVQSTDDRGWRMEDGGWMPEIMFIGILYAHIAFKVNKRKRSPLLSYWLAASLTLIRC
jgi:hypothetical protein